MGILISLPLLTHEGYIKYKEKRSAQKARKLQSQNPAQQQSHEQTSRRSEPERYKDAEERDSVEILRQGLLGEETASPLSETAWRDEGRRIGGTTSSSTETDPHTRTILPGNTADTAKRQTNITMASDSDYASFLDKVNQDPSGGVAKTDSKKEAFKTTDVGVAVPTVLKKAVVDAFYVSDADEPFELVGLNIEGGKLPDEATFAKTINHPSPNMAQVEILDVEKWDPQGQYKEIVDAVRSAVKGGDVKVYRVESSGARVEYWVLGVEDGKLLGVKALSVES